MKKRHLFYFCLIGLFVLSAPLRATVEGDILLQLRFYEGVRGPKPAEVKVVTSYTLRPLFVGNFITEKGLQEEEAELKRVFNLKNLAVLVQTQWSWGQDKTEKRFQMMVLNGHEFLLQVVKLAASDAFQVQVIDQGAKEKRALLDSKIVLPAGKVSVFGFEDSLSQPYFLAMQRQADAASIKEADLQLVSKPETISIPKILKKVDPIYPEKMLSAGVDASVTLKVDVDKEGKVWIVQAFSEENEFVKAAIAAIKQWQIEPLVIDGKAQPQAFTCTVNFLKGDVALDFSKVPQMNIAAENLYRKIRHLCFPSGGQYNQLEKITLRFKEEPVSVAAQILSRVSSFRIRVDTADKYKLNCDLRDIPWDLAMALLLEKNGLDIVPDGDGLLILRSFQAIWPTYGYLQSSSDKPPDNMKVAWGLGKSFYITSLFGKRVNPFTKKEDFHTGLDIAAKKGSPVLSAAAGTVAASELNDQDGNLIHIDHGNGYTSAYHHLDSRQVKKGDTVAQGQLIGTVGSTGVSMGPHLHFEIRYNDQPRNPLYFIGPSGK